MGGQLFWFVGIRVQDKFLLVSRMFRLLAWFHPAHALQFIVGIADS